MAPSYAYGTEDYNTVVLPEMQTYVCIDPLHTSHHTCAHTVLDAVSVLKVACVP